MGISARSTPRVMQSPMCLPCWLIGSINAPFGTWHRLCASSARKHLHHLLVQLALQRTVLVVLSLNRRTSLAGPCAK